jgi:hypothetical protein
MINVQSSTLFNNFIKSLPVENVGDYYIDPAVVNDIYAGLGLESETELFSVKVSAPVGAGLYVASAHFKTASDHCMISETVAKAAKENSAQKKVREATNERVNVMTKNGCFALRPSLERYYLAGKWRDTSVDEFGDATGTGEDIDTAFFSAKESCRMYEQALVTIRDEKYGLFDTQMQNYIEENLASVIANIINSSAAIAEATGSLKAADAKAAGDMTALLASRGYAILDMQFQKWKVSNDLLSLDISIRENERQHALTLSKTYLDKNKAAAEAACTDMVKPVYESNCGATGNACFVCQSDGGKLDFTSLDNVKFGKAMQQAAQRYIKIKGLVDGDTGGVAEGTIIKSGAPDGNGVYTVTAVENGKTAWDDYQVNPRKADGTRDTSKNRGWYVIQCTKVLDMNSQFLKTVQSQVQTSCNDTLRRTVSERMAMIFTGWTTQ